MDIATTPGVLAAAQAATSVADLARVLRGLRQREAHRRREARLTYREIAEYGGWSVAAVGTYLSGSRLPSADRLNQLARILGADAAERTALEDARERAAQVSRSATVPPTNLALGLSQPWRAGPSPRSLPAPVGGFVGRHEQLARLDEQVAAGSGAYPIVISALTGMGGVGKTALALHWAHRVSHRFPDGQLFVDLRGYAPGTPLSTMDAFGVLLSGLGVGPDAMPRDVENRSVRYRELLRGRTVLVVLDNARSAEQVVPLLPPPPSVAVVTSRDTLAELFEDDAARRVELDALAVVDAVQLLRLLVGPRVDAEPAAAAALAARCGYLPLALRVAAEHAAGRPGVALAELVDELSELSSMDVFEVAGDGRADVRTVFSWSLRGLPAPTSRLFTMLGLFPGVDIDRYGLAALAGADPDAIDELALALRDAHLLQARGTGRYGLHDLLRAYAGELAEREVSTVDRAAAAGRLLDYYVSASTAAINLVRPRYLASLSIPAPDAAQAATPQLRDIAAAAAWLAGERVNLVRACERAAEPTWPHRAIMLAIVIGPYLWDLHYDDMLTVQSAAAAALANLGERAHPGEHAAVQVGLGQAYWRLGRLELAIRHLREGFEQHLQAGNPVAASRTMALLGAVLGDTGRFREALEARRRGAQLVPKGGGSPELAVALTNVGWGHESLEEFEAAHELFEEAYALADQVGQPSVFALVHEGLAASTLGLGRYEHALAHAEQALQLNRSLARVPYELRCAAIKGSVLCAMGRASEALDHLTATLARCREVGSPRPTAAVLNALGAAWYEVADYAQAIACYAEADAVAERHGNHQERCVALEGTGVAHAARGDRERAREYWRQAYDHYVAGEHPAAGRIADRLASLDA